MFRSGALLVLCLSTASAQPPVIPDTRAGRTFTAWLEAFNSGDRKMIGAYAKRYEPNRTVDEILELRAMTGGFHLTQVTRSERLHLDVLLEDRNRSKRTYASLDVTDADPAVVTRFKLYQVPPWIFAASINTKIDGPRRARVIDSAVAELNAFYVVPEVAKQMSDALRAHQQHADYDTITDGQRFAELLTATLQDLSHDKHLLVEFIPFSLPPLDTSDRRPLDQPQLRKLVPCEFQKAEILPDNIGYIQFNAFAPPAICAPTASAAMSFVANADALIFDLRDNHGGDPDMVAFILSYLFDRPTHLSDVWTRRDSSTHQFWTLPYVPGDRWGDKPVYVLTSKQTFSSGEWFAYDLKNLKRATIVGETTGGGAHTTSTHYIDSQFLISVPSAATVNPISHANWEGTGVAPDVKVPADSALMVAEKLAADTLRVVRH